MYLNKFLILTSFAVLASSSNVNKRQKQASIVNKLYFPSDMPDKNNVSHDRVPIVDKLRCKANEDFIPGDNESDWTCDCKSGYIYYPMDDDCYEAYKRGPCNRGEMLVLPTFQKSPKCILNQCKIDGYVHFNRKCHQLDSSQPCTKFNYLIGRKTFLTVKLATFELTCADNEHTYECNGICCVNRKGTKECFQKRQRNPQQKRRM